ncbi:MAG: DUF2207 domain-containing protein [Candidatus Liptonbacteria bacterium]|nr:DUF2207 domain-containing protein [Candidatus Liptonbacteria bacterium]
MLTEKIKRLWEATTKKNVAIGVVSAVVLTGVAYIFFVIVVPFKVNESIDKFDVKIALLENGEAMVTETLAYNFSTRQKPLFFRTIPLVSPSGFWMEAEVLGVKNELGESYEYATSSNNNGLLINIKNPTAWPSKKKTYVITYRVGGVVRTADGRAKLRWNATGDKWPIEIKNASASVFLEGRPVADLRPDCFAGLAGSAEKKCSFSQVNDGQAAGAVYFANGPLKSGEGLTIILDFPQGSGAK